MKRRRISTAIFICILISVLSLSACTPIGVTGILISTKEAAEKELSNDINDSDSTVEVSTTDPLYLGENPVQPQMEVIEATPDDIETIKSHLNYNIPNYSPGSSDEFAMNDYRYSQCENDEQRRIFLEFVRQVTNDNPWCYVTTTSQEDFDRARNLYEHSVPFYRNYKLTEYSGHIVYGAGYYAVEYKVIDTDEEYYERCLQECVNYANTAPDYLGKVNAVNYWICGNIAYDWNHQSMIESSYTGSFANVGTKGMTCCQGYSRFAAVALSYTGIASHTVEGGIGTAGYHSYLYLQAQNGRWYVLDTCWEACGMHCWVLKGQASVSANDNQYGSHRTYDYEPALSPTDFSAQDNYVVAAPIDEISEEHPTMTEEEKKESIKSDKEKKEEERQKAEKVAAEEEKKKKEEEKAKQEEQRRVEEQKATVTGIEASYCGNPVYLGDSINKSSIIVNYIKGDGSREGTDCFTLSKSTITDDGYGNCKVTVSAGEKSTDLYIPFKMPSVRINISGNNISVSADPGNINYNLYSTNPNVVQISGTSLIAKSVGNATICCDWSYKGYSAAATQNVNVGSQVVGDWQYAESAPTGDYEVEYISYYKYYYFENGGHVPQWNNESVRLTYTEVYVPTPFSSGYVTPYNGINFNTIYVNGVALVSKDGYGWRVPTNFTGAVYEHESGEVITGVRYKNKTYVISAK